MSHFLTYTESVGRVYLDYQFGVRNDRVLGYEGRLSILMRESSILSILVEGLQLLIQTKQSCPF
jgi:hypothetical protein